MVIFLDFLKISLSQEKTNFNSFALIKLTYFIPSIKFYINYHYFKIYRSGIINLF